MSRTLARYLTGLVLAATAWQKPMRRANTMLRVANALHPRHSVATDAGPIAFVSTHPQALDYPAQLLSREPETIAWLDAVDAEAVVWDIGANVGAYALYAGRRGARVWAFEPAPASFAALSENVRINRLDDRIAALPIALGGETAVAWLEMTETNPGSVSHLLVPDADPKRNFRQSVVSYTVDAFRAAFGLPWPTHIKLDVDGIEGDILAGASEVLANPRFRSLLVEVDDTETAAKTRIRHLAETSGLALDKEGAPDGRGHRNAIFSRMPAR